MRKLIVGMLATALGGCNFSVSPKVAVEQGKDMVASHLKDPKSAVFRDVYFIERSKVGNSHQGDLCGSVNARNSFGGYAGESRFVASFEYTDDGRFSLNALLLERELAGMPQDGATSYFQGQLWLPRCSRAAAG